MKTEPDTFSIDDLIAAPNSTEPWDGIRNYQARNFLRDEFSVGDLVFIYHSRVKSPGVVGIAEIVRSAYPDHTALDPESNYFDPKSLEKGESRWVMVDVKAVQKFDNVVTLITDAILFANAPMLSPFLYIFRFLQTFLKRVRQYFTISLHE